MKLIAINLNLREKLLIVIISGFLICFTAFGAFRIYEAKTRFTANMDRSGKERWKAEVGVFFDGVSAKSTDDELRRIAPYHPVFRVVTVSSS